jgi:4-oxalocrotonate tautomerase
MTVMVPPRPVDKKRELVRRLTEAASDVYEIPPEKFMIHVIETGPEETASGGVLIVDK